jgi:nitrite reductase/ring-hydroxylating ferredoxin subunit
MQPFGRSFTNHRRPAREGKLVTVCRVEDVPEGCGATVGLAGGRELALYRAGGQFYAVENFCPHRGAPLAGACLDHSSEAVETYEVAVEDGWIKVRV